MNTLIPLIFSILQLASPATPESQFNIALADGASVVMVAPVDTVTISPSLALASYDVLGDNGGSRRIIATIDTEGRPLDVRDAGSFGAEGFSDDFYITDRRGESVMAFFEIADANPTVADAPEGGVSIEMTDRIVMTVIDFENAQRTPFVLRDNQVTFSVDLDGHFRLTSVRPRPNDIDDLVRAFRVCADDGRLDANAMAIRIARISPILR